MSTEFSLGLSAHSVYPPPDNPTLQRLRGSVLDSVTLYRYQLSLRFEDGNELMVRVSFCFDSADKVQSQEWIDFPLRESAIARALGASVTEAHSDESKHLWIHFSCGDVLVVAWTAMYECYELTVGGDHFLV